MGKLGQLFSTSAHDLVGIQSRIEEVERLLDLDSDDVARVVGILGKGGIGKTTLAAAVYDRIFHKFDASCFLADVGKVSGHPGLVTLQEQLLRETLDQKNLTIRDVHEGTLLIRTRLSHLRTLIVLDNVDGFEQLEALAIEADWFGEGTRVIIITRYEYLLERFGVDEFYAVDRLNDEEALRLFCTNAFKCDYPKKDYVDLIYRELQCLQGHPLSIKLWGSYLLNQNVSQWESALDRMKRIPYNSIHHYIQASYDALKDSEKETFLDIACFFTGEKINYVEEILRYRGFYSETAIRTLIDRSFINILDQRILMHDLVRELGLKIIKQELLKMPAKRTRWSPEVISYKACYRHEALALYPDNVRKCRPWDFFFKHAESLRLLIFRQYPETRLPSGFYPRALVQLIMPNSSVRLLWKGIKALPNLKNLDLRNSKDLIKTPDFRGVLNLERLDLEGCTGLLHLDSSTGILPKLKFLNLRNCTNLVNVPNTLFGLSYLENLNLAGCSKLAECLDFDDWKSSMEVKLPSNQDAPLLEVHPNAAGLFKKPFPHFDELALVFGKDRATGMDAEDPTDAVEAMDREMQENTFFTGNDVDIDEAPIDSVAETQLPHSPGHYSSHTGIGASRGQDSASSGRGKRKRTTGSDAVIAQLSDTIQTLGKVCESTKDNIGDLVGCFKHEKEGAERRMQVFEELKKIESLTSMERVKVGFLIAKDQSAVDYFFTIDAESKVLFVQQILAINNH